VVGKLPLKDLLRRPVCWASMVHFWKPWKQTFWPPPECREPFSMLPRHALSSIMVWNAGIGPWWVETAEIFRCHLLSTFGVDPFKGNDKPTLAKVILYKNCRTHCEKRARIPSSMAKPLHFIVSLAKGGSKIEPSPQTRRHLPKSPQDYCKHAW
jgi:hypothetical protein